LSSTSTSLLMKKSDSSPAYASEIPWQFLISRYRPSPGRVPYQASTMWIITKLFAAFICGASSDQDKWKARQFLAVHATYPSLDIAFSFSNKFMGVYISCLWNVWVWSPII
jgi:hypothetical protein